MQAEEAALEAAIHFIDYERGTYSILNLIVPSLPGMVPLLICLWLTV